MDFIFMLTRNDRTVSNCLDVLDEIAGLGIRHIGFKDIGVSRDTLKELVRRIGAMNATSWMEVVSTTADSIRTSIETAADIGANRVLGGQDIAFARRTLAGDTAYYPFPGRPVDHPTRLEGLRAEIETDCRQIAKAGCAGADLLAYRAVDDDPLALVRAARKGLGNGDLIVAGDVDSPARMEALARAGANAITIGTAIFNGAFAPEQPTLAARCMAALKSCRAISASI